MLKHGNCLVESSPRCTAAGDDRYRLDEIIQAEFNEKMKETLSKELFEIFLERLTQEIIDEIKKEKYQGKFN